MNHDQLHAEQHARRKANEQRYEAHSKETLKRNVSTKFQTTMIGALVRFEEAFGELWGHGRPERDLTRAQAEFRKRWNLLRTEVLNNGNNQQRAAMMEIDQYTVKYNKMEYQFSLRNKQELTRNDD